MNFHILTLFPEMVLGGLGTSITGRAMEKGVISVEAIISGITPMTSIIMWTMPPTEAEREW